MVGDKKMMAIGVGCKRGCASEAIVALVRRAMNLAGGEGAPAALFTLSDKAGETGLSDAAQALGLPLVFLNAEVLRQAAPRAVTHSPRIMRMFGLPSIAETAALAGAGPSSILLVPRMSEAGASCAIANRRDP
jgi:cobalt-precorrin 5A hydrolase